MISGGDSKEKSPGLHRGSRRWNIRSGLMVLGGRKLTMAISTLLTGVFLFLFTTSRGGGCIGLFLHQWTYTKCHTCQALTSIMWTKHFQDV
ncbi:hypothetical protein P691DRAFT_439513 [Macrolepiota fuliginosa MF-IS2]|uniref:Uncharacterized protein n=1 Tax=Macrolepiota fuliginosa MF-IS2 TaxID=1400762 RepID=A0A9P6BYS7_9AGAR|nr:hypothetical protein P691DRAFT_439513 [Macrolepiota fuliginosa MF-IS2]